MANQPAYRKAHLAKYAEYQRNSRRRNARQHLVYDARARAKRNGIPCDITAEDLEWPTNCPVFGVELLYARGAEGGRRTNSATLDRRDNTKGYVKGNVFVISHRANRIKSDATPAEIAALARYALPLP